MSYFARDSAVDARRSNPGEMIFGNIEAPPDHWIISMEGVAVAVFSDDDFRKRFVELN